MTEGIAGAIKLVPESALVVNPPKIVRLKLNPTQGFIYKKEGLQLLLDIHLTDTVDSFWNQFKENDIIGKYYKNPYNKNYTFCLIDHSSKFDFETHILFDLKPLPDGSYLLNDYYRVFHGNYPCCWNNAYEGFYFKNGWFHIKSCGTGSGYCSSYIRLFKVIKKESFYFRYKQDVWSSYEDVEQITTSQSTLTSNRLTVRYTEKIKHKSTEGKLLKQEIDNFHFTFELKNNQWVIVDSTRTHDSGMDLWYYYDNE